jgi:hypothetical protein
MDIDLRNPPKFSNIPEGGLDLAPYAIYQAFFAPEYLTMVKITVGADLTVDCGPHWEAVTEGGKIIGFNRAVADVTADA